MPITPEQLAADKKLCAYATPGPWSNVDTKGYKHPSVIIAKTPDRTPYDPMKVADGHTRIAFWGTIGKLECEIYNATFVARARTALPEYIAEVERLMAENRHVKQFNILGGDGRLVSQGAFNAMLAQMRWALEKAVFYAELARDGIVLSAQLPRDEAARFAKAAKNALAAQDPNPKVT